MFDGLYPFCVRLATYGLAELQMEGDGNCQVHWKEHPYGDIDLVLFPKRNCIDFLSLL